MSVSWLASLQPRSEGPVPRPGSSQALLDEAEEELGRDGVLWATQLAAEMTDHVITQIPEFCSSRSQYELHRRSCEATTLTVLCAMARRLPVTKIELPVEVTYDLRSIARQGISQDVLSRVVWDNQTATYRALVRSVVGGAPSTDTSQEVAEVADQCSLYIRTVVDLGLDYFASEQRDWRDRLRSVQRRAVEGVISGQLPAAEAEQYLGVRLSGHHLAAVAWDVGTSLQTESDDLARFAVEAGRAVGAEGSIAVEAPDGATWVWWTWVGEPERAVLDRLRCALGDGMAVAVGPVAAGSGGFARSHQLAQCGARVARMSGTPGLWNYEDVKLAALMTADLDHARQFVHDTLGGLAGSDAKTGRLRTTLYHYLLAGRSRVAAARRLHMAPNSVAYRVQGAEALLPPGSCENVMNLLVALQLAEVVGATDTPSPN